MHSSLLFDELHLGYIMFAISQIFRFGIDSHRTCKIFHSSLKENWRVVQMFTLRCCRSFIGERLVQVQDLALLVYQILLKESTLKLKLLNLGYVPINLSVWLTVMISLFECMFCLHVLSKEGQLEEYPFSFGRFT